MFKPAIHGGLRGLILASAASLMFGSASWSLEFGGGGDDEIPAPEEEGGGGGDPDPRSALEKVKDARSGGDASSAAKDLRNDRPGGHH